MEEKKIMSLPKVKLFKEASASYNWHSGYHMGDLVKLMVKTSEGDEEIVIRDSREYYKGNSKYEAKHGELTLVIDYTASSRPKYLIVEKSAFGKKNFDWNCLSKRKNDLKEKVLTKHTVQDFFCNLYKTLKFHPIDVRSTERIPQVISFDNYYEHSNADFHAIEDQEDKTDAKWKELKSTPGFDHHHSPSSASQYLLDKATGNIYRYSDHWGYGIRSCNWYLDGETVSDHLAIGVANISEFVDNKPKILNYYTEPVVKKLNAFAYDDIKAIESIITEYKCDDVAKAFLHRKIADIYEENAGLQDQIRR